MRKFQYIILPVLILLSSCNVISKMDKENSWKESFTVIVTPADSQLTISWTPVSGATSYQVWYNTTSHSTSAVCKDHALTDKYFILDELDNETTYYIWVRVNFPAYTTEFGTPYSGIPFAPTKIPDTPAAPVVTSGNSQLIISWNAVAGATYYKINIDKTYDFSSGNVLSFTTTGLDYTLIGLNNGTTYYISVSSGNALGSNGKGVTVSGTPHYEAASGTLPTVTTASIVDNTTFTPFIAGNSARCGGEVTSAGSSAVYNRGICWSTDPNMIINVKIVSDINPSGTGIFNNCNISGFGSNTTIYVRAYARNNSGTSYGNIYFFDSGYTFGTYLTDGYVFYNDGNGGGLVASEDTYSTAGLIQWYNNSFITTGATGTAIGDGLDNTEAIVTVQGNAASYAAHYAAYYDAVYLNWYLPSIDELQLIYTNLYMTGSGGTFQSAYYWSSTEYNTDSNYAWCLFFSSGYSPERSLKSSQFCVRPVRSF